MVFEWPTNMSQVFDEVTPGDPATDPGPSVINIDDLSLSRPTSWNADMETQAGILCTSETRLILEKLTWQSHDSDNKSADWTNGEIESHIDQGTLPQHFSQSAFDALNSIQITPADLTDTNPLTVVQGVSSLELSATGSFIQLPAAADVTPGSYLLALRLV